MSENTAVLRWENIAPDSDTHAALVAQSGGRQVAVAPHGHADFCELFLVTAGVGKHIMGRERAVLQTGDLRFLRPGDTHAITAPEGSELCWTNIAFPVTAWREFKAFAPLPPAASSAVRLSPAAFAECAAAFDTALRAFVQNGRGDRHQLARFLGAVLPHLCAAAPPSPADGFPVGVPAWLRAAAMPFLGDTKPAALEGGVCYLRERAGVSGAHLARALRSATGQTPTQWVNAHRLRRAALLLSVTNRAPAIIAAECGFGELGYFYRCFRETFGTTPGAYRRAAPAAVLPPLDRQDAPR